MWSSTSLQSANLHLPLLPKAPKTCLLSIPEPRFSPKPFPAFTAAPKWRRSPVLTAAKAPGGSKDSVDKWTSEGLVTESLPNGMFRVKLDNTDMIIGYICGKIRKSFIRILPGDRVKVEVSRYDSTRGRIVYRLRNSKDGSS